MPIKKRNTYKKRKKRAGRKEKGVVFHEKTKSKPSTVV